MQALQEDGGTAVVGWEPPESLSVLFVLAARGWEGAGGPGERVRRVNGAGWSVCARKGGARSGA